MFSPRVSAPIGADRRAYEGFLHEQGVSPMCDLGGFRERTSAGAVRDEALISEVRYGAATEPWAILRYPPNGTGVEKHSVNPCLVTDLRNVDSGGESPVQRVISSLLLGLTRSASGRYFAVDWVLTIASRRSVLAGLLRRETGNGGTFGCGPTYRDSRISAPFPGSVTTEPVDLNQRREFETFVGRVETPQRRALVACGCRELVRPVHATIRNS